MPSPTPAPTDSDTPITALPGVLPRRNLAVICLVLAALWAVAVASHSAAALGALGVVTVAVVALGLWVARYMRRQRELLALVQGAADSPAARRAAIETLKAREGAGGDVMVVLARAQLEAQDDTAQARATLASIDLARVPAILADQVRLFHAQMCLLEGNVDEAAALTDGVRLQAAQQPEIRGLLTATVAEARARTGRHVEALELLEAVSPDDPGHAPARTQLLTARVFASFAAGRRDKVFDDLRALAKTDVALLGRFVAPQFRVDSELTRMVQELVTGDPDVRRRVRESEERTRKSHLAN